MGRQTLQIVRHGAVAWISLASFVAQGSVTFDVWSSEPTAESNGTADWAAIDDGEDINPVVDKLWLDAVDLILAGRPGEALPSLFTAVHSDPRLRSGDISATLSRAWSLVQLSEPPRPLLDLSPALQSHLDVFIRSHILGESSVVLAPSPSGQLRLSSATCFFSPYRCIAEPAIQDTMQSQLIVNELVRCECA
jgi:hypothetical protein